MMTKIVTTIVILIVGFVAILNIASTPNLPFGVRSFIVGSGSMRPSLNPGDIVIAKKTTSLKAGDIITFNRPIGQTDFVTHRIVKIENNKITTKGDANNIADETPVYLPGIYGKVIFSVPKVGLLLSFTHSFPGTLLIVGIPTLYVIVSELIKIIQELKKSQPVKIASGEFEIIKVCLLIFALFPLFKPAQVNAYYLTSGTLFTVHLDTTANISVHPGDIVINEINWAGSTNDSNDEWIELRNTTNHNITISSWQITKWVSNSHEGLMLTVPDGKTIAANSLFLISDKNNGDIETALTTVPDDVDSGVTLANDHLQVKLYDGTWNSGGQLIDTAGDKGVPLAGKHDTGSPMKFYSMERNTSFSDGTNAANWHDANTSVNLNSDSDQNKGTPKANND